MTGRIGGIEAWALDLAVRRFPRWVAKWRVHGVYSSDLHALVPAILAEYRMILAKEAPGQLSQLSR